MIKGWIGRNPKTSNLREILNKEISREPQGVIGNLRE
jgi:hypothetical protein